MTWYFLTIYTVHTRAVPIVLERLVDATTEQRTRCENTIVVAIPWDDPVAAIRQDALNKGEARKDVEGFYHRMYALYSSLIRITPVKGLDDNDTPAVAALAAAPISPMKSLLTPVKLQTNTSAEPTTTETLAGKDAAPESAAELSALAESEGNRANDTAASHAEVASATPAQTHDIKVTLSSIQARHLSKAPSTWSTTTSHDAFLAATSFDVMALRAS